MVYPEEKSRLLNIEKVLRLDKTEYEEIVSRSKSSKKILRECHKYTEGTSIFINDSVSNDNPLTRIELKGQGCRELESRFINEYVKGYYDVMYNCLSYGGWTTRFDVFIDVYNGSITTKELDYKIQNCEYVSVFRKVRFDGDKYCKDYSSSGWGYLFGSENSGTKLRIYDKLAEQIAKGKEIDVRIKSWIRYEIRFYHDIAKTMSLELINNLANMESWAYSLLKGIIEFKEPSNAINKSEWKIWKKWEDLLGNVKKTKPYNQFQRETNLQVSKKWYSRSATKVLEQTKLIMSHEEMIIESLKNEYIGLKKITQSDLNEINIVRSSKGLQSLSKSDIEEKIKRVVLELRDYNIYIECKEDLEFGNDVFGDILKII